MQSRYSFELMNRGLERVARYGDIELSVISILLLYEAKRGGYMCDRRNIERKKQRSEDRTLWYARNADGGG